uniref:Endonuclease/exonuclease/phosphatase domain-containing protein n=1 Tax=Rhizophagus irregularis (strain DAOM 181602 / DAOM 197198 / MUCL 43194) TaxID=747089 RepID=U9UUJ7_RHIID
MIKIEPMNYKHHITKQRGRIMAEILDIPNEIDETTFSKILKTTNARYWFKTNNRMKGTYNMKIYFNNDEDRKQAINKKIKIDGKIFTWFFRTGSGRQNNFRNEKRNDNGFEIVHTKIETTGMTTKMKRIAIGKADTTMKEILDTTCNDNILAPTMTIDTTPTPKEETIHTQEEDLTTTIIEKMAEMRLEENDKVLTTNNRDITETMTTIATVTMPIDTTSTEKITTMDITEEGMKETTETMTGVEWLDAINWIPQTYNTIREGEEEEEGEKNINDRRYKVEEIDGHVFKLDILFKDKQKGIKVIGIYNPNNDKEITQSIEKRITSWINEAQKLNQELLILGDFNESTNKKIKSKPLIQVIKKHGLEDVHECLAGKDILDTWKSGEYSSRIDYIFASENILGQISSHEILDIEDFETDHKALTINIELKESLNLNKKEYFKKVKVELKRIILEPNDWEIIAERLDDKLLDITETDLDREDIWATLVTIYEEEKIRRINEIKDIKEMELKQGKDKNEDLLENKIYHLIRKYETLEKINNIEHEIIKLIKKVIKLKWRKIGEQLIQESQTQGK